MPDWLSRFHADAAATPLGLYVATYVVCLLSGFVPLVNTEAYLLSVSAFASFRTAVPLTAAAALGQMTAKALMYLAGRGVLHLPLVGRHEDKMAAARAKLDAHRGRTGAFVFGSAFSGFPPFYVVSVLAGTLRLHFGGFFAAGVSGRFLRFGLCVLLPHGVRALS
jgi:membrane protein YqaA with SNARE-associated domain